MYICIKKAKAIKSLSVVDSGSEFLGALYDDTTKAYYKPFYTLMNKKCKLVRFIDSHQLSRPYTSFT